MQIYYSTVGYDSTDANAGSYAELDYLLVYHSYTRMSAYKWVILLQVEEIVQLG